MEIYIYTNISCKYQLKAQKKRKGKKTNKQTNNLNGKNVDDFLMEFLHDACVWGSWILLIVATHPYMNEKDEEKYIPFESNRWHMADCHILTFSLSTDGNGKMRPVYWQTEHKCQHSLLMTLRQRLGWIVPSNILDIYIIVLRSKMCACVSIYGRPTPKQRSAQFAGACRLSVVWDNWGIV